MPGLRSSEIKSEASGQYFENTAAHWSELPCCYMHYPKRMEKPNPIRGGGLQEGGEGALLSNTPREHGWCHRTLLHHHHHRISWEGVWIQDLACKHLPVALPQRLGCFAGVRSGNPAAPRTSSERSNVCLWIRCTAKNLSDSSGVIGRAQGTAQNTVAAHSLLCSYQIMATLCDALMLKSTFHTQMDYY